MIEKQQIVISHRRQGLSIRETAKVMKLNRKTVKRYLRQYEQEKARSKDQGLGVVSAPKYDSSNRIKTKLTKEVTDKIDHDLDQNAKKRHQGLSKQCKAGTDIHESLIAAGHEIGYRTVCKYIRKCKQKSKEIFIKQVYDPGSESEFDWGTVKLKIGGKWKKLKLGTFTLCYSNHRWAELYTHEGMPSFLDAHVRYLANLKGVPGTIVYDNMKVAVAKFTVKGSDKKPTDALLKISSYYQFSFRFCNAAKGNEKGHVERSVEYIRRKAFAEIMAFDSLDQANEHLRIILHKLNSKSTKGTDRTIIEKLQEERQHFATLPPVPYDTAILKYCVVDKYHTIQIDTNYYSIPESIHTPRVGVRIYPEHINIYDHENQLVATHQRQHTKYQWVINIDHYWNILQYKPGALRCSQAMVQANTTIKFLFMEYYKDIPRDFIELMLYCKQYKVTEKQLYQSVLDHSRKCLNSPPSSEKIIYLLSSKPDPAYEHLDKPSVPNVKSDYIIQQCTEQLSQIQNLIN